MNKENIIKLLQERESHSLHLFITSSYITLSLMIGILLGITLINERFMVSTALLIIWILSTTMSLIFFKKIIIYKLKEKKQ